MSRADHDVIRYEINDLVNPQKSREKPIILFSFAQRPPFWISDRVVVWSIRKVARLNGKKSGSNELDNPRPRPTRLGPGQFGCENENTIHNARKAVYTVSSSDIRMYMYPDKTSQRGKMANPADASMHAEESKPSGTSRIGLNIGRIEAKLIVRRVDPSNPERPRAATLTFTVYISYGQKIHYLGSV